MSYVDCFVAAVPTENKAKYIEHASSFAELFKEFGALEIVEKWGGYHFFLGANNSSSSSRSSSCFLARS